LTGFAERRTALMPPVPAPESSDATAAFCAAVLRELELLVPIDAVEVGVLAALEAPYEAAADGRGAATVGRAATGVRAALDAPYEAAADAFGFEAVPVVGRYIPPPTYIVAIALLLNRDCQCAD
jgi:hypothetical protein